MSTTNHISFEELAGNFADVLNKVRAEHKAVVVEYANGEKVVIKPLPVPKKVSRHTRKKTEEDYNAFYSSAGGWHDVDIDTFIKQTRENRAIATRPPVEL
jgi:hypothetical protein